MVDGQCNIDWREVMLGSVILVVIFVSYRMKMRTEESRSWDRVKQEKVEGSLDFEVFIKERLLLPFIMHPKLSCMSEICFNLKKLYIVFRKDDLIQYAHIDSCIFLTLSSSIWYNKMQKLYIVVAYCLWLSICSVCSRLCCAWGYIS